MHVEVRGLSPVLQHHSSGAIHLGFLRQDLSVAWISGFGLSWMASKPPPPLPVPTHKFTHATCTHAHTCSVSSCSVLGTAPLSFTSLHSTSHLSHDCLSDPDQNQTSCYLLEFFVLPSHPNVTISVGLNEETLCDSSQGP